MIRPRFVFDLHQHVGATLQVGLNPNAPTAAPDRFAPDHADGPHAEHVRVLEHFGFDAAAVMPGLQYERPYGIADTRAVNTAIAAYRDAMPTRFPLAMGTSEPLYGTAVAAAEVTRLATELQLDGVVWHTRYQGVATSDRRVHALVDVATEHGLPCLVHMFAESTLEEPWMIAELAKQHPDATIVVMDGFSSSTQAQYVMDLADRFTHLYFDTAVCFPLLRLLHRFVNTHGSRRLLFGTDSYADGGTYDHPAVLHELLAAGLTQEQLDDVFWRNAARVFPRFARALKDHQFDSTPEVDP